MSAALATADRTLQAAASATVAAGGRLIDVVSAPPLTLRRVFSEEPDVCALCLVGSAAGPLPGDNLLLSLEIGDGARASLIAAGATIAQGRAASSPRPASVRTLVTLGEAAALDADPGALIVCAGSQVDVTLEIDLEPTSTLIWRELLVLGRSGEPAGSATLRWNVTRGGEPLLRQFLDLSDPRLLVWPGMLAGQRTVLTELRVGPDVVAETFVHSATDVTQRVADRATLRTTLG
ncbi:urease accessory protein [Jatrophihabitans sp. GAS493]|uniref:urease accessory protein UreD n=1 Tax=Jatrophihabitans sp. GAS493 TaxID=1907575 RepID=UPI000BB9ACA3|nr:urease accessory protein UreD [Jatrophihabitans sp. GAS493]SOD71121.1 urease accessory protein [Jatrophihabitans sp. GAS493]